MGAVVGELSAKFAVESGMDGAGALKLATTMSAAAGALVGGPDSAAAVNVASQMGANAAQNNFLSHDKLQALGKALATLRESKNQGLIDSILEPINAQDAAKVATTLDAIDKRSDALLNAWRTNPSSLSANEVKELGVYVGDYARVNGAAAANELLRYGPQASMQNADVPGLMRYAQGLQKINAVQQGQAAVGTPALSVLSGAVGTLVRAVQVAQGSYQTGQGVAQVADGAAAAGLMNVGLGLLNVGSNVGLQAGMKSGPSLASGAKGATADAAAVKTGTNGNVAAKLPTATDATTTSPYSSSGTSYGKTTLTDVNGKPIPTQATVPGGRVVDNGAKGGTAAAGELAVPAPKVSVNSQGITEITPSATPLNRQGVLNMPDVGGNGKLKPTEAAAAADIEPAMGNMQRYDGPPTVGNKAPDFQITDGPNAGKTVDLMYTTAGNSDKEIAGMNKFFEKNMTVPEGPGLPPKGVGQIQEHFNKADVVVMDFRTLTPSHYTQVVNISHLSIKGAIKWAGHNRSCRALTWETRG